MEGESFIEYENEIFYVLDFLKKWENLFTLDYEYFIDGWAIYLNENNLYPRYIVLFKSYDTNNYSIKSYETHFTRLYNKKYKELVQINNIEDIDVFLKEIKDIIYGKDFYYFTKANFFNKIKRL
ncbi:MAG: hypothetical protein KGD63_01025 [Candidatus Lokiarchaeota archaeon]|nr:hypothetical protein [Candidatus Lokiarchaeota archaeon]